MWVRTAAFVVIVSLLLVGCASPSKLPEGPDAVGHVRNDGELPSDLGDQQATAVASKATQEPAPYPLSEPGPYYTGKRTFMLEDASRGNRRVSITVWYPAVWPEGLTGAPLQVGMDLAPDPSGAPYPLILSSTKVAHLFAPLSDQPGFRLGQR
jgi:hypothetical protein